MGILMRNSEKVWSDIVDTIKLESLIYTFKGKASAKVLKVDEECITLGFYDKEIYKEAKVYKKDIDLAVKVLIEKGKGRQKDITTNKDSRYVLGVMKLLPYFEKTKEATTSYLVING